MSKRSLMKGAKGKNLEYIKKNLREWDNEIGNHNFPFHLEVPDFFSIPSKIYEKYINSEKQILFISGEENKGDISLERLLLPYIKKYKKINNNIDYKFIVRSSAVYSEDGYNLTGAGIYNSIVIKRNEEYDEDICTLKYSGANGKIKTGNFKYNLTFTIAVFEVYLSMFTKKAIKYRKDNGIINDTMSIVIQEYLDFGSDGSFLSHCQTSRGGKGIGYFNSLIKGQPSKCKIVKNGIGYILNRENLLKDLDIIIKHDGFFDFYNDKLLKFTSKESRGAKKIFLTPLDTGNFNDESAYFSALFFLFLEKKYGKYLQAEFAMDFNFFENGRFGFNGKTPFGNSEYNEKILIDNQCNNILNLLQIRPLPQEYLKEIKIKFPKKEALFIGEGIGVGKIKLKNLSLNSNLRGGDYSNKKGILVCDESEGYTNLNGSNELPKSGGVIVVYPSDFHHGHLETIISERDDLIGVFTGTGRIEHIWNSNKIKEEKSRYEMQKYYDNIYKKLNNSKTIEIISDGIEARVYID